MVPRATQGVGSTEPTVDTILSNARARGRLLVNFSARCLVNTPHGHGIVHCGVRRRHTTPAPRKAGRRCLPAACECYEKCIQPRKALCCMWTPPRSWYAHARATRFYNIYVCPEQTCDRYRQP